MLLTVNNNTANKDEVELGINDNNNGHQTLKNRGVDKPDDGPYDEPYDEKDDRQNNNKQKNKRNGALPKMNNQNTVIMRAATKNNKHLMLMHNTRIFYFKIDPSESKSQSQSLDYAADEMTKIINGIYIYIYVIGCMPNPSKLT